MINWDVAIRLFSNYLKVERGLSANSVEAYLRDVRKLEEFISQNYCNENPTTVTSWQIEFFVRQISALGLEASSQARILSGIKAFYKFLCLEDLMKANPAELIEAPKLTRKLPDVLEVFEIERLLNSVDLSTNEGLRNRAILEVLYSCGLRVSECASLKISDLHLSEEYIKVFGKGNKQRLVPIGKTAIDALQHYLNHCRQKLKIDEPYLDFVFLNRRGRPLSRVMIFNIVKNAANSAGIKKRISPHTLRHSFASHLVEGGANLRAVQQMLGHESITTTEIYTHLDTDFLRSNILLYHPLAKNSKTS